MGSFVMQYKNSIRYLHKYITNKSIINNMNKNSVCIFAESGEYVKFHNLLSISMAAIANALKEAVGVRFERLPMKPEVIVKAIQDNSR